VTSAEKASTRKDTLRLGSVEVPFSQRQRAVGQSAGTRALSLCSGRGADEGVRPHATALLRSGRRRPPILLVDPVYRGPAFG
jgi:hypothetical protein